MERSRLHRQLYALWAMSRPSQLALITLVYVLGALIAVRTTTLDIPSLVGGLLALLPVAVSVHYVNEYADYETDRLTDRTPFSGGSGALQRTGLDRQFAWRAAWPTLGLGVGAAVVCVSHGFTATTIAMLAMIAVFGWQYSVGPLALVWRGGGEVTNAVLGGLFLPVYAGSTQTGAVELRVALAMVPFTILVGVNLLPTHWPDREADAAVGKSTLPTRWGPSKLRRAYAGLTAWGYRRYTRQRSPFPAVAAMVTLALCQTTAWLWLSLL